MVMAEEEEDSTRVASSRQGEGEGGRTGRTGGICQENGLAHEKNDSKEREKKRVPAADAKRSNVHPTTAGRVHGTTRAREREKEGTRVSRTLGTPREVAHIETEGTELGVATADADGVDARSTNLGHGSLTTELMLTLLDDDGALATGVAALVARSTGDT